VIRVPDLDVQVNSLPELARRDGVVTVSGQEAVACYILPGAGEPNWKFWFPCFFA
jgi:hypothetical protein